MDLKDLAGRAISYTKAPEYASGFIREAFNKAINGVGRLPGAVKSAERRVEQVAGDREEAIDLLISTHLKYAGAQGFVTNLGGLLAMAVLVPANVAGLALIQCHLVAGIAHLRGYDLADPRVRNAVLACMIGPDGVKRLVKKKKLPGTPYTLATAHAYDPALNKEIATEVTNELITRAAGKRTVGVIGRRIPILGGGVGAVGDAYSTRKVGKYAANELRPQKRKLN